MHNIYLCEENLKMVLKDTKEDLNTMKDIPYPYEKKKIRIIKASFQSKVTTRFKVPPIKLTKGWFCFCFYMCLLKNKGKLARKTLKK